MEVKLNPYIQKVTEKWIRPILMDHGCDKIMPNLSQWKFEQTLNPRLEEWTKLTQHQIEDSNEKQDREIIPINGKIKLSNNIISLELLLKFVAIRTDVTEIEIDQNKNTYKELGIPNMVLIAAAK